MGERCIFYMLGPCKTPKNAENNEAGNSIAGNFMDAIASTAGPPANSYENDEPPVKQPPCQQAPSIDGTYRLIAGGA